MGIRSADADAVGTLSLVWSPLNPILFTPLLTTDFKSVEAQDWHINTNLLMGIDISRAGYLKRFRILFNYYHGYSPYGQFFYLQKTESFGAGAYLMF